MWRKNYFYRPIVWLILLLHQTTDTFLYKWSPVIVLQKGSNTKLGFLKNLTKINSENINRLFFLFFPHNMEAEVNFIAYSSPILKKIGKYYQLTLCGTCVGSHWTIPLSKYCKVQKVSQETYVSMAVFQFLI